MHKYLPTILLTGLLLLGCDQAPSAATPAGASAPRKPGKTVSASISGYNHSETEVDFSVNGYGGGYLYPGGGGGSFVCCISLPDPWYEGYSVTIRWEDSQFQTHQREVKVPQYDPRKIGSFNVHFLRNGEIKVFAVFFGLGHPDYPLKGEEAELIKGVPIEIVR